MTQMSLLKPTPYQLAVAWRDANPEGYRIFAELALEHVDAGQRFGMKYLGEIVRYRMRMGRMDADFKVNNNLLAPIGRLLAEDFPRIEPFMETRAVDW